MAATYTELYIDKGSDFNKTIRITNPITNNVVNIAGYTIRSKMKRSFYNANSVIINCSIPDAGNGEIKLSIDAANTANLKPGSYVFDVETINTSNIVARTLEGRIIVSPEATY